MSNKLTKSDIQKIEEEISYRRLTVRKELLTSVKEAREHGDLSENFEYHAAKREKNKNESRIRYLEKMLKTALVIDDSSKDDEVGINNVIELLFVDDNSVEKYKIVTSIRGNSTKGYISIESPIGKAIIGKKCGEIVKISVNETIGYFVKILSIDNSPDDSDDKIKAF